MKVNNLLVLFIVALMVITLFGIISLNSEVKINNTLNEENKFDIDISSNTNSIEIKNADKELNEIYLQEYIGKTREIEITTDFVYIDDLEIEKAIVTLEKKGKVDAIFRCDDFLDGECSSWEKTDIVFEDLGYSVRFEVNGFSGYAGGEILAIDAVHLTANYEEISNIFEEVKKRDGVWSERIYENEIVRVEFESNLTNGKMIDVFVRSNGAAYFDIYEAGTTNKVARSSNIEHEDLIFIPVSNLSSNNVFDFVVRKVEFSENIEGEIYLEFDFIHDDVINNTHADGLIVYAETTINSPRYRIWDEAIDFGAEQTDTTDTGGDTTWVVSKSSTTRDEILVGTENDLGEVNVEIFNASGWNDALLVSSGVTNAAFRSFDIAYEKNSGDALIVYENSTAADSNVAYRIWNGTV